MEKQIDICATCVHDEPGYCSVIGTIPHCCSRHWHCEPGKAAKDYVPNRKKVKLMARDEVWDALKNHAKQVHSERVAKNPDRIAYAIQQFEAHGIEYQLKNEQTGHYHCWRKSDDKLFQFYAGTGKIQGFTQVRGLHSLIQMLEG